VRGAPVFRFLGAYTFKTNKAKFRASEAHRAPALRIAMLGELGVTPRWKESSKKLQGQSLILSQDFARSKSPRCTSRQSCESIFGPTVDRIKMFHVKHFDTIGTLNQVVS
jgi:hypothetical protein